MLGSHHAQITEESYLEYSLDENITDTVDRVGNFLFYYSICFGSYIHIFLISFPLLFLVSGAKLHEAAAAMPPPCHATRKFKTLKTKSLGHAASILFWNNQQVDYKERSD